MLKLLKYEWKACARTCLPLYGVAILMAVLGRFFMALNPVLKSFMIYRILGVLGGLLYSGVMVAVFVITLVILVQRFYKNLLGNEGYLMFTLPVTVTQLIWSKTIVAFAMSVISVIASGLSALIMAAGIEAPGEIFKIFSQMFSGTLAQTFHGFIAFLELMLFLILAGLGSIMFIYLCIALGHMAKKHREAMTVVWFFALSTGLQLAFTVLVMLLADTPLKGLITWVAYFKEPVQVQIITLMICAFTAAVSAGFFLGTKYILQNKLNLE